MEEAINYLTENYDLDLDSPIVREAYEIVKNGDRSKISSILKNYYRPTLLNMGTVGAYLWGSSQNYYGAVSKSCSVLNNSSLFEKNDETCQYQIWTYKNGLLKLQGESLSSKAYIYVEEDWNGFNYSDIEKLKDKKIENACILNTIDNKHNILIKMVDINHLPILKNFDEKPEDIKEEKNSTLPYYIFLLIFIIIFIKIYYGQLVD